MPDIIDQQSRSAAITTEVREPIRATVLNKLVLLLGALILVALLVRVWGLTFGLPYRYHIDETFYVALALKLPTNNFDMPAITHGPNLFYLLLLVEYAVYYVFAFVTGQISSMAAFEQIYRTDPTNFVLLARFTSAVAGTLTLIPTYLLGKKHNGALGGVVAASLLGFAFQHVRESHYGTPDVFVGLLVSICLLACVNILEKGRMQDYVLAGVFAGLATGTKFTNVLAWLPILLAHTLQVVPRYAGMKHRLRHLVASTALWAAVISFLGAFAIAYPNLVLRPVKFLEYVRFLVDVGKNGFVPQFIIEPAPAWYYYLYSLSWGLGWFFLGLLLVGTGLALIKRKPANILLLCFAAVYLLFLAQQPYYASRYLIPLLPVMCVLAADGIMWLSAQALRFTHVRQTTVLASLTILTLIQPVAYTVRHNYLLGQSDTRTLAKAWIEENIPAGNTIAVDWAKHTPPLRTMDDAYPESSPQYQVLEVGGIGLPQHTIESYRADGVNFLVISSFIDSLPLADPVDSVAREAFHESLRDSALVYEVKPNTQTPPRFIFDQIFGPVNALWQMERPGPALQIYRVGR